MPRVLVGSHPLRDTEGEYRTVLSDAGFDLVFANSAVPFTEADVIRELAGCDVAMAGAEPYSRQVMDAHPQLRMIARTGVGFDAIDLAAATERGIPVTIAPGNAQGVAEQVFAFLLALAKDLPAQGSAIRAGRWPRRTLPSLRGSTLAVAGLGRVGKAVAIRARAFGMRVIAYDPVRDEGFAALHAVEWRTFEDLFAEGDFVTLHMPLNDQTRGCVAAEQLGRMKPAAYLINTARGGIVDEGDLYEVLSRKRIAGAGLDVFEREPPTNCPLLKLDNVVLSAHTAGIDERSRLETALVAATAIVDFWQGRWPGDLVVNPEVRRASR